MVCVLLLPCKFPSHSCIFPLLKCAITTNPVTGAIQICYLHIRPGMAATCIWATWKDLHYSKKFPYFKQKCYFHLGLTSFSINYALCPPLNNHISYSDESRKKAKYGEASSFGYDSTVSHFSSGPASGTLMVTKLTGSHLSSTRIVCFITTIWFVFNFPACYFQTCPLLLRWELQSMDL